MKGMTMSEYKQVVEFAQEFHPFANYVSKEEHKEVQKEYPKMDRYRYGLKYIDATYDSRDAIVWCVTMRRGRFGFRFSSNHFAGLFGDPYPKGWKYDNLFDLCMDFLKGEFIPKDEFIIDLDKDAFKVNQEKESCFLLICIDKFIGLTAKYVKEIEKNGEIKYTDYENIKEAMKFDTWHEAYKFVSRIDTDDALDIVSNLYVKDILSNGKTK